MAHVTGETVHWPLTRVGPDADGLFAIVDAAGRRVAAGVSCLVVDKFVASPALLYACEAFVRVLDEPEAENAVLRFCDAARKVRAAAAKAKYTP